MREGGCVAEATRLALRLKDKCFEQEREWRLMSIPRPKSELKFRVGASMIVPYVEFSLQSARDEYLDSVIIGPTPNPGLARESVQFLLHNLEVSAPDEKVIGTRVPYRNW
jgi:hypothetical protein